MGNDDDSGLIGERRGTNGIVRIPDGDQGWQPRVGVPGKRTAVPEGRPVDPVTAFLRRLDMIGSALDGIATRQLPAMREAIAARAMQDARRTGGALTAALGRVDADLTAMKQQALLMENAAALTMLAPLERRRDACRVDAAPLLKLTPPPAPALSLDAAFAPHLCLDELAQHDTAEAETRVAWSAEIDASEAKAQPATEGCNETTASSTTATNVIDAGDRFRRNDEANAAAPAPAVQRRAAGSPRDPDRVHAHAAAGVAGTGAPLPHIDVIQRSFGAHDVTGVSAHVGGDAAEASAAIGAEAYATGNHVAFAEQPSLFVAAHEAAHVVQQRAGVHLLGGVGEAGDQYEQQADAVAECVVRGDSAEGLLGHASASRSHGSVQRKEVPIHERIGASLDDGYRAIRALNEQHLPEIEIANSGREFERARNAAATIRFTLARAEESLRKAKSEIAFVQGVLQLRLLEEIRFLAAKIEALRPTIDQTLRLAPAKAVSRDILDADSEEAADWDEEANREQSWDAGLDQDEARRWANATEEPVHDDRCQVDGAPSPEAVSGIHLYLTFKVSNAAELSAVDETMRPTSVGPGFAGPYKLIPHLKQKRIGYYLARHLERDQYEWVIGPDSISDFVATVGLYVGAARTALPGSEHVEGSQADGAAKAPHHPSLLEKEAGLGDVAQDVVTFAGGPVTSTADAFADGLDEANGGPSLVAARNAHVRLRDYVAPAEQMARELKARVDAGEIELLEARDQAVNGRNLLMHDTRAELTPSARLASEKSKADKGRDVKYMKKKKTGDLLSAATEHDERGWRLRQALMEDSAAWGPYVEMMETTGAPHVPAGSSMAQADTMKLAMEQLGSQPIVSRSIIESSGHSNRWVTRFAKVGRAGGAALGALGVIDAIDTVLDADAGQRAHVAARELSGFAGGVVGAELGAGAAVWTASLIAVAASGPQAMLSAPVVVVVSLIGGALGASAGAKIMPPAMQSFADVATTAVGVANPMHMSAAGGGFTGMYQRGQHEAMFEFGITRKIEDAAHALVEELRQVEKLISEAPDRAALEQNQRERLSILTQQHQLDDLLLALRTGAIDEAMVVEQMRNPG